MKRVSSLIIAGSLALPALVSSPIFADDIKGSIKVGVGKEDDYPNLAKITLEDAVKAALTKVPGKAVEAELDKEDGYLVYEVKIVSADKKKHELKVDAGTKEILKSEEKNKFFED